MTITIKNASYLNLKSSQALFTANDDSTIYSLLSEYQINPSTIKTVTFLVNGSPARYHDVLKDGDVVIVIPVIVGG
jgi:sulfur carrier protein ThiS